MVNTVSLNVRIQNGTLVNISLSCVGLQSQCSVDSTEVNSLIEQCCGFCGGNCHRIVSIHPHIVKSFSNNYYT